MAAFRDYCNYTITYYIGNYFLKEVVYTQLADSSLTDEMLLNNIFKWYYDSSYNDYAALDSNPIQYLGASYNDTEISFSLYANPNEGLNTSLSSMHMANVGNIVSPNGAAIIFGAETDEENAIDLTMANEETYNPYNIVIVEEDTDESIPAEQITFSPDPGSALTGETVQTAINELEQIVYNSVPVFTQEVKELDAGVSYYSPLSTFSTTAMMVYYNGLLINEGIHYTFTGNMINFLDFTSEEGDIITIIGLASSGGSASSTTVASAIGGSY